MDALPIRPFVRVRQDLPGPTLPIDTLRSRIRQGLRELLEAQFARRAKPSIAIAVGSRGIRNLELVVRTIVETLHETGARPFVVPAMGSHGGATAEGQEGVLAGYGITEARIGCPVRSSLETVVVAQADGGYPVHFDKLAFEADGVLLVNRVKPHTKFRGPIESGLCKMLLIGLGKAEGAKVYHRAIEHATFSRILETAGRIVLARCPILGGVALLENGREETADVHVLRPERFLAEEPALLERARSWLARLPMQAVDLLIVDEMGKNLSGSGMDTNVIGRRADDHRSQADERPNVLRIAVRSLTEESHGNALGIGLADFCTQRLVDRADLEATRVNAMTSLHLVAARLPFVYPNDRAMLAAALTTLGLRTEEQARIVWIKNTLELATFECSSTYREELSGLPGCTIVGQEQAPRFDRDGDLPAFGSFREA